MEKELHWSVETQIFTLLKILLPEASPSNIMAFTNAADLAKSILLPTFDSETKNFQLWWTRFKAYASVKLQSDILNQFS